MTVSELSIHFRPRFGAFRPPARYVGSFPHHVYNACVRRDGDVCAHVVPRRQSTRYFGLVLEPTSIYKSTKLSRLRAMLFGLNNVNNYSHFLAFMMRINFPASIYMYA